MTVTGTQRVESRRRVMAVPVGVGAAFTVSWLAGLAIPAPSPLMSAPGATIVAAMAGHGGQVTANFVFTEGLPAIWLAVVSAFLARALRARNAGPAAAVRAAGLAAAAISLTQCVLGLALVHASSPGTAAALWEMVNRLDGVKMFALAVLAAAAALAAPLPGWLRWLSAALAVSITASGAAFLFLLDGLAWLAYPAGVLLLAAIPAAGYAAGRILADVR